MSEITPMTAEEKRAMLFGLHLAELVGQDINHPSRTVEKHWQAMTADQQAGVLKVYRGADAWFRENAR